jgi:hypothetical protein
MSDFYPPNHEQIPLALLNAILTHPDVVTSQIYPPVIIGETPTTEPVRINSARDFAGTELIEPGLTLAVFPLSSNFRQKSSSYSLGSSEPVSVRYSDYYLGRYGDQNYAVQSKFWLVVQLFYQDASFNAPIQIESDILDPSSEDYLWLADQPSRVVQFKDGNVPSETRTLGEFLDDTYGNEIEEGEDPYSEKIVESTLGLSSNLTIFTNPAERILRLWTDLLVKVVRSLTVLRPFAVKNPTIEFVDYPTTNWYTDSSNLVFHTSYFICHYDCFESFSTQKNTFFERGLIRDVNIQES